MTSILSYAEAEKYRADFFFYDHEIAERNPEKSTIRFRCVYCSVSLNPVSTPSVDRVFSCERCGWWQTISNGRGFGIRTCVLHRGVLARYPLAALDVPLAVLRKYLQRTPSDVAHINPSVFERLMRDCLKDALGPCEVVHVGGTADRGVDLILIRSDEGPRLIQVKRRAKIKGSEGVQAVRELNGVLLRENVARGMVITTASRFTKAAISETSINTVNGQVYDMKLLAYDDVVELFHIKPSVPHEPWLRFLTPFGESSPRLQFRGQS